MNTGDWEAHFLDPATGPSGPDPLVTAIASRLQPGRALDLACGAGGNALWLAEQGWNVTAVDRSPAAIEIVRRCARERGLHIATSVADLEARDFTIPPGEWDLILMCRYLQRGLFEPARLGLAPGGVLIVIVLLAEPGKHRFRMEPGELSAYFSASAGWRILHQREGESRGHPVAEIAVRRDA